MTNCTIPAYEQAPFTSYKLVREGNFHASQETFG